MPQSEQNVVVHGQIATATAQAYPGTIIIRQHPWVEWVKIAIDQEQIAAQARHELMRLKRANDDYSPAITSEFHASMIALAACAHAIDGFYNEVEILIGVPDNGREKRHERILRGLGLAFVHLKLKTDWARELPWLFRENRDELVHSPRKSRPNTKRHTLGFSSSYEVATYKLETVRRALLFTLEMLEGCIDSPIGTIPDLAKYCDQMTPYIDSLRQRQTPL